MFGSGTNDDLKIDAPFCGVAKKSCGKKNAKQKIECLFMATIRLPHKRATSKCGGA